MDGLQPQLVRPQLYIASIRTELCKEVLEQNGITHILQVGVELQASHPKHFQYLKLPLYDMPEQDIVTSFPAAFEYIDTAMDGGGGVLVHCQAGISRSATVVIAYCMWKERLSAAAATAVMSAARDAIWPNMGFKTQLQEFEKLGWDASKWQGWSMDKFLQTRYGHDSVDFMATMLGGAPEDRVAVRQQQCAQGCIPDHVADSPFAHWAACSNADYSSVPRQTGAGHVHGEVDSCPRSRKCSADQRLAARPTPKSPLPPLAVSEASHGGQSDVAGSSCGGCCRQSPSTTRRMSLACYCGPAGGTAAAMHGSSSGSSNRLRRHSTGQYALAAAAAGVTAMHLGNYKHMSFNTGTRLPEEAALLMAG